MSKASRKPSLPRPDGLERPWPSSPGYPPNYIIRVKNLQTGGMYHANSYACYAIRKIVDVLLQGASYNYEEGQTTLLAGVLEVHSDQLAEIMTHQYSPLEVEWALPVNYDQFARNFVEGLHQRGALELITDPDVVKSRFDVATPPDRLVYKTGDLEVSKSRRTPVKSLPLTQAPSKSKTVTPSKPSDDIGTRVAELTATDGGFNVEALRKFAEANDVWKGSDAKLSNGLMRMTVVNRLRGKVKKDYEIKWGTT